MGLSADFQPVEMRMRGCVTVLRRAMIGLIAVLAACSQQGTAAETNSNTGSSLAVATVSPSSADEAAPQLTESDRIVLGMAESACRTESSAAFVDAFIRSRAVQRKFTASTVELSVMAPDGSIRSSSKIVATDYNGAPITMVDYYRKAVAPFQAGDTEEYVMISISRSQSNQLSVEWTRVHFDGKSEGGDDLGRAFDLDGAPYEVGGRTDGQLLFAPTTACWELVADVRYQRGVDP